MYYTVGEVAKKMHLPPSTLRYYDKEGLLPFVERSKGGIRMFKDEDLPFLEIIQCLKETGMSIAGMREFVDLCMQGDASIDARLALINRQYQIMLERQKQMQQTIQMLRYKQWYYITAQQAGTCDVPEHMPLDDIPREFHDIVQKHTASEPVAAARI